MDVKQIILNAIGRVYGTKQSISLSDVDIFGVTTSTLLGCNTRVTVRGKPGNKNVIGSLVLHYNRNDPSGILSGLSVPVKPSGYARVSDVIAALNTKYRLELNTVDFVNNTVSTFPVTLVPSPSSLLWQPINVVVALE